MSNTHKRVFAAVPIPYEIQLAIARWRSQWDFPKPVAVGNFHITLRFAKVDPVFLDRLLAALDEVPFPEQFTVRLSGLGAFPHPRKAEVAWLGVQDSTGLLSRLAASVEEAAQDAGLGALERPFRGHITLARIRPPQDLRPFFPSPQLGVKVPVREVVLYESRVGQGPSVYEPLEHFPL